MAYAPARRRASEHGRTRRRRAERTLGLMGRPRWPGAGAIVADVLLAGALFFLAAWSARWWGAWQHWGPHQVTGTAYALMLAACLGVAVRRVWPPAALAVTLAATVGYLLAGYPYGPILLATVIGVYSLAVHLGGWRSLAGSGVALAAVVAAEAPRSGGSGVLDWGLRAMPWAALLLAAWAVGTIVRLRGEAVARSRQEDARRQAYEQRLEIAREVHDVVGHGLAVINMQANIALHVRERRPEQADQALQAIRQASKDSLDQLRRTLAVFREGEVGGDAPREPPPGLSELPSLVSTMEGSGLPVELEMGGARGQVPAAVDLAAYRILQESLTNVLRHAGGATALVRLAYSPEALEVEVTNAHGGNSRGAPRPPGHGIAGMRERASAVGGDLEAGPRPEGGFRVRARLPLTDCQ
jgi:signal transduction histidine kinase